MPPPSAFGALSDAILTGRSALPRDGRRAVSRRRGRRRRSAPVLSLGARVPGGVLRRDGDRAGRAGFDAVIGNPPWDMIRADAGSADARSRARGDTGADRCASRATPASTRAQSDGHANRYQLFVERAVALTRPGGRIGLVLPSGLVDRPRQRAAAPAAVLALRRRRARRLRQPPRRLSDSSQRPLPAADGDTRPADAPRSRCRLGETDPAVLESIGDEPADDVAVVSGSASRRRCSSGSPGDDLALPDLRSADRSRDRRAGRGAVPAARRASAAGRRASAAS